MSSAVAASRSHLAWAAMQADAGELAHAHDTLQLAGRYLVSPFQLNFSRFFVSSQF